MKDYRIVFAQHFGSRDFVFKVPAELEPYIKKDTVVLVETCKGLTLAKATTDVMVCDVRIVERTGAYLPLKNVVGIIDENVEAYIENEIINCIRQRGMPRGVPF